MKNDVVPVSVAIPSFQGEGRLPQVLEKLAACSPRPAEILIHADGNWKPQTQSLQAGGIPLRYLYSETSVGPGGGRGKCIQAAENDLVASFDDDSWPLDRDYFFWAHRIMEAFPSAAALSPAVYLKEKPIQERCANLQMARYYQGSASVHRRSHILMLHGYVPLAAAYGIEEADLSLQIHAAGLRILETSWIRAWHDRPLADNAHQIEPWIRNEILFGYLRYPVWLQPWTWTRALRHAVRARALLNIQTVLRVLSCSIESCQSYRSFRRRYSAWEIGRHAMLRPTALPFSFDAADL